MDVSNLPSTPGCYFFKDKNNAIIYIGKAKNLKKRVSQYVYTTNHAPKTVLLLRHAQTVDFVATDSEVEALLLENRLIKLHQPRFNVMLRDGKSYAYIKITDEPFPRVISTRRVTRKGEYIGPFTDGFDRIKIVNLCQQIFMLRTCEKIPKKVCLNYHIGRCSGPCEGFITKQEYDANLSGARALLRGDTKLVMNMLLDEMTKASASLHFERAKELRDQIYSLQRLLDHQKVDRIKHVDQDVIAVILRNEKVNIGVLQIKKGVLLQKQSFCFGAGGDVVEEFLCAYYDANPLPAEIIIEHIGDADLLMQYFERRSGQKVLITMPSRGEKMELLKLAVKNLQLSMQPVPVMITELARELNLPQLPIVIEGFDISHLMGTDVVAGMVQFYNAKPNKSEYRLFHIKSFSGQDDVAAIYEVVKRRYSRLQREHAEMPDLILIDGGKGQVGSAQRALHELGLRIPVLGLAKKEEELFLPGASDSIKLDKSKPALRLLIVIRDEVHRFAIGFHRRTRAKTRGL
ncbi:MAG: excinuclease ABC subunit UvrC [Nanoarchaeota archaeon]